ncbi:ATP-binding sensor histidine kinase [Calothrix sp. NIES-2098]|uniref:ATP-binding sensor histidine kinase n=1 Tax=Calothrix sp. NIES-2098 TaxID=1954171 RepID=UPI000B5F9CDC|nr:two-component hybrid sensor and regulator [Calothrix sp. NIES-2098]
MVSTQVSISGYQVMELIYDGSKTLVYRAIREQDSLRVIIKLLKNPYPSFSELVQFRNQYTIAKNLNFPGIIQTYSLEPYQNGYILVMEDFGGISLNDYFTHKTLQITALQEFLPIAISLCDTLDFLYRHRIIHKDIKPANIVINPETKQVKLIDFSIASLLARETQSLKNPQVLEGTLSYLSPEQTGRMNRVIDYRTDFYSLGVTFYELLTSQVPFNSTDLMELVHCHIAKIPPSVNRADIPRVIDDILQKLMAKNAEDRYQSALGLKYDLEKCLEQINATGEINYFEIGKRDICDRFTIPEKLYGREPEVQQLLTAFERVAQGNSELMLVAGFSGIGKTVVVNEVHKPIVKQRGYFIKGKFDQFNRNIPFSAFVQAFRDLMGQLLAESDTQIQQWKSKIIQALGKDGQVIIDVIPELEKIIGQQPSATELSGIAAQNRFNLLFQKFLQLFTSKEHPLVIFLDDLQWADFASLKLIQLLISETNQGYLLLIGAYRDNEVSATHPLMMSLDGIRKTGAIANTLTLQPLSQLNLNQLVVDTLKCAEELAVPLSQLIYRKTQGNPFFSTQFLKSLHEDGLINFNWSEGCWECDIAQINQQTLTSDVVEFMSLQLRRLPESTQQVLKLAACIGNSFDLPTLAIVCQLSEVETAASLWKSLQLDFILPQSAVYKFYQDTEEQTQLTISDRHIAKYKFLHDRIQQAAYSLIQEEDRQRTHLQIGRSLLASIPAAKYGEHIFDIVNQLNIGRVLINDEQERTQLAKLNLIAGKKAKTATAYTAAIEYSLVGLELLSEDSWENQYQLTLELHEVVAEAAYLSGNFAQMQQLTEIILQNGKTLLDKVPTYEIQITACIVQSQQIEGIQIARSILQQLGINFPEPATSLDIQQGLQQVIDNLQGKSIAGLVHLPIMTTPEKIAAMKILMRVLPAAFQSDPVMVPLIAFAMVQLSIQYGNTSVSAYGYSLYGLLLCGAFGDIEAGCEFGKLALGILSKFNSSELKAKILTVVNAHIAHWQQHIKETLSPAIEGYSTGLETGDLEYAGYCAYIYPVHSFWLGKELEILEKDFAVYVDSLTKIKQKVAFYWTSIYYQTVLNLQGKSAHLYNLVGTAYDEEQMLSLHQKANDLYTINHLFVNKLFISYLFNQYDLALNNAEMAEQSLGGVTGLVVVPLFYFYDSLVRLALYSQVPLAEQQAILEKVQANQEKMEVWANHAPMNYLHKFNLVNAEKYRVLERNYEAGDCYDRAISLAKSNGYTQEEALANELAAKFYLDWGKETVAAGYMQQAYYCYTRWGSAAKTDDLETRYPQLLKPILQQRQITLNPWETISTIAFPKTSSSAHTSTASSSNISEILDFTSILKAAQTISSSIELDELLINLTKIILENSGAKKSALILPEEDTWQIRAITFINSQTQIQTLLDQQLLDTYQDVPKKIINYVKNTQKTIVIDNCQTDIPGLISEYILTHQPKSVLCTPIINQGNLIGILYLENQLTSGVFTPERLQLINLLSSQAAISLENARLFHKVQQALENLQQAQLKIVQSEKMSALGNLVAGVAHEMNNPLGFISASLKQAKPNIADISKHLRLYQETLANPSEEIIEQAEEIDIDYILEDLPKMMDAMVMACDRLKNISTSLRTFSRADKDYKVPFNIHQGIDSTILILKHRLKANEQRPAIEVVTEYGDLPQIECFPGQLNQVFMNILANAIDALEEANNGRNFAEIQANPNKIKIRTFQENNYVKIKIADNGLGIPETLKDKIFEHLFTTKAVGKGTGLGLAIARQIVEETHSGKLTCNSVLGEGTEFSIEIPL